MTDKPYITYGPPVLTKGFSDENADGEVLIVEAGDEFKIVREGAGEDLATDKPAFTKGPWRIMKSNGGVVAITHGDVGNEEDCVIDIGNDEILVSDANAALIAAAPDMYEALKDVFPLARRFLALQRSSGIDTAEKSSKVQAANAALRKAEGVEK